MKTESEIIAFLESHKVSVRTALQIGQFLQRVQKPIYEYYPAVSRTKDAKPIQDEDFIRWFYDYEPMFEIGDKVELMRETHQSVGIVEMVIVEDEKPRGTYCIVRNINNNTIQRVNQNKLQKVSQ